MSKAEGFFLFCFVSYGCGFMFSCGSFVLRVLIPGLSETASRWTLCHGGPSYPYHSHMVLKDTTLAPLSKYLNLDGYIVYDDGWLMHFTL